MTMPARPFSLNRPKNLGNGLYEVSLAKALDQQGLIFWPEKPEIRLKNGEWQETPEIFGAAKFHDAIATSKRWSEGASLINLMRGAVFLDRIGRLSESEKFATQALQLLELNSNRLLNIQHLPVEFAFMLESQGRTKDAEFIYRKLLDSEHGLLKLHSNTSSTAALAYVALLVKQGRKGEAEKVIDVSEHEKVITPTILPLLKNSILDSSQRSENLNLLATQELATRDVYDNEFKELYRPIYDSLEKNVEPSTEDMKRLADKAKDASRTSAKAKYDTWASLINLARKANDHKFHKISDSLLSLIQTNNRGEGLPPSIVVEEIIERTLNNSLSTNQTANWTEFDKNFRVYFYDENGQQSNTANSAPHRMEPDLSLSAKLQLWAKAYLRVGETLRARLILEGAEKSLSKEINEDFFCELLCDKALVSIRSNDSHETSQTLKKILAMDFNELRAPHFILIAESLQRNGLYAECEKFLNAVINKLENDKSKRLVHTQNIGLLKFALAESQIDSGNITAAEDTLNGGEAYLQGNPEKRSSPQALFLRAKMSVLKKQHGEAAKAYLTLAEVMDKSNYDDALKATKIAFQKHAVEEVLKSSLSSDEKAAYLEILAIALSQTELKLAQEMYTKAADAATRPEERSRLKMCAARLQLIISPSIESQKHIVNLSTEANLAIASRELMNLATSQIRQGNVEDGIASAQQAIKLFAKLPASERKPFIGLIRTGSDGIPIMLLRRGKRVEAENLLKQSSETLAKIFGKDSQEYGQSLAEICAFEIAQKNYDQAKTYSDQALKIYELHHAELMPNTFGFQNLITACLIQATNLLLDQGQNKRAKTILGEIEAIQRKNLSPMNNQLSFTLLQLAKVCQKLNLESDAASYQIEAEKIRKQSPLNGPPPPFLMTQMNSELHRKDAQIQQLTGIAPPSRPPIMPQILYRTPRQNFVSNPRLSAAFTAGYQVRKGYIDKSGKWIIKPKYDLASIFIDNIAIVSIRNSKENRTFGINSSGDKIFDAGNLSTQVINFDEQDAEFYLQKFPPNLVPNAIYNLAGKFDGKYFHEIYSGDGIMLWNNKTNAEKKSLADWIEKIEIAQRELQKVSLEAFKKFRSRASEYGLTSYDEIQQYSSLHSRPEEFVLHNGIGITRRFYDKQRRQVCCVIDKDGKLLSKLDVILPNEPQFRGGLLFISTAVNPPTFDSRGLLKKFKLSAINAKGETIIKPFDFALPHGEHLLSEGILCFKKEDWYGAIDQSGKEVIPFKFYRISPFTSGLAVAEALANQEGEVIPCDDERFGPETQLSFARKCAQAFTESLKNIDLPHFRFRASPSNNGDFEFSLTSKIESQEIKQKIEQNLTARVPEHGPLLKVPLSMSFIYDKGRVFVGFVKDDPQIDLIQKRYFLYKNQRNLKTQNELDSTQAQINQLNAQIGEDYPETISQFENH